jgi:hypothetical protein
MAQAQKSTTRRRAAAPVVHAGNRAKMRQRMDALKTRMNHRGTTVLSDFGRLITNVPHKNTYPLKFYMSKSEVLAEPIKDWLRERYLGSKTGKGVLYEVRTYTAANGKRYVDYILLEKMSKVERMKFVLQFGTEITENKVERDGKKRRPRLTKEAKKEFDAMVDRFYAEFEAKREQVRQEAVAEA